MTRTLEMTASVLDSAGDSIGDYLPRLAAALGVLIGGLIFVRLAGRSVASVLRRAGVDRLAQRVGVDDILARGAILAVFAVLALGELGMPTTILEVLAAVLAASTLLTFTLAFGLGGRDVAREVTAGRYVSSAFTVGQEVSVAGVRGTITAIERAAVVLEQSDGLLARVPNHLLLDEVVLVHRGP